MRLLFHGTSHPIKDLASVHIGQGGDPNSALGFHTSDSPFVASEYADISSERNPAENSGKVVVIQSTNAKFYIEGSYYDFFGVDEEGEYFKTHDDFSEWRNSLVEEGYQLMEMDEHEDEIVVILDPSSPAFRIVAELTPEEARILQDRYDDEGITYADSEERASILKDLILERQATLDGPHETHDEISP